MTPIDLFTTVHKGLRAALFGAAGRAARADFAEPEEAAAVVAEVRRALRFVDEHARLEEAWIVPVVARHCPELAAELRNDHVRSGGGGGELLRILDRFAGAPPAARLSLGRKVNERLAARIADELRHFEREELAANRVLWANCDDGELDALRRRIVATLAPERRIDWLELLLPAVNRREREELLRATVDAPFAAALPPGALPC